MTFEEFKKLALNPPYTDDKVIYRLDLHYIENKGTSETEFSVSKRRSYLYPDLKAVGFMLNRFITKEIFNKSLYAVYVYELPFNKDIENDLYRKLWVYDKLGNLISQSVCSALVEDLDSHHAKFRGRSSEQIAFEPGDIVEIYNHKKEKVERAIVVESPLTIEQCWLIRESIKQESIKEGLLADKVDENYYIYDSDDNYLVVTIDGFQKEIRPTDVFPSSVFASDELRKQFISASLIAKERSTKNTSQEKMSVSNFLKRKQDFTNLLNSL